MRTEVSFIQILPRLRIGDEHCLGEPIMTGQPLIKAFNKKKCSHGSPCWLIGKWEIGDQKLNSCLLVSLANTVVLRLWRSERTYSWSISGNETKWMSAHSAVNHIFTVSEILCYTAHTRCETHEPRCSWPGDFQSVGISTRETQWLYQGNKLMTSGLHFFQ